MTRSNPVLDSLVRSQMWSHRNNLMKYRRLVLDADSVIHYLFNKSIREHVARQKAINCVNTWSGTLIDWTCFASQVESLINFLIEHQIQPIIVYGGKQMEARLFGLISAEFKKNTDRVSGLIDRCRSQAIQSEASEFLVQDQNWPNVALNIFKLVISCKLSKGVDLITRQASYRSFPLMMKLARDYACPVLTNDGEFILYDVRAGFILLDQFWHQYVDLHDLVQGSTSQKSIDTSTNLVTTSRGMKSPRSRIVSQTTSPLATPDIHINFHYNYNFVLDHPGLNPSLCLTLIPFLRMEFILEYGKSLRQMRVFDRDYTRQDFMISSEKSKLRTGTKLYHDAANRLEKALDFVRGKSHYLLGGLIRSEAERAGSDFDHDFSQCLNYHMVSFDFATRLRYVLKYLWDEAQLHHLERVLVYRECTASFLCDLFTTSIGHLASVTYNSGLQLEDPETKNSAWSLQDRARQMLMSCLSNNQIYQGEKSARLSNELPQTSQRSSSNRTKSPRGPKSPIVDQELATLTLVDRKLDQLTERELNTSHPDKQLDSIRSQLTLELLASDQVSAKTGSSFMNIIFKCKDLTKVPNNFNLKVLNLGTFEPASLDQQVVIKLNLIRFALAEASNRDDQFTRTYMNFQQALDFALVATTRDQAHWPNRLRSIARQHDLKRVALRRGLFDEECDSKDEIQTNIRLRHLLELLTSCLELYTELNGFLNYPMPILNIHLDFNPILLFNLMLFSYSRREVKHKQYHEAIEPEPSPNLTPSPAKPASSRRASSSRSTTARSRSPNSRSNKK